MPPRYFIADDGRFGQEMVPDNSPEARQWAREFLDEMEDLAQQGYSLVVVPGGDEGQEEAKGGQDDGVL